MYLFKMIIVNTPLYVHVPVLLVWNLIYLFRSFKYKKKKLICGALDTYSCVIGIVNDKYMYFFQKVGYEIPNILLKRFKHLNRIFLVLHFYCYQLFSLQCQSELLNFRMVN